MRGGRERVEGGNGRRRERKDGKVDLPKAGGKLKGEEKKELTGLT